MRVLQGDRRVQGSANAPTPQTQPICFALQKGIGLHRCAFYVGVKGAAMQLHGRGETLSCVIAAVVSQHASRMHAATT